MSEFLTAEQLDALPEGAQIIDRYGDISTKRDRLWHSYETAPMWSAKVAKWMPRLFEIVPPAGPRFTTTEIANREDRDA